MKFRRLLLTIFLSLMLCFGSLILFTKQVRAENKVGVNITDNFNVVDRAINVVNANGSSNGGWIVVMPRIGNCTQLTNIFSQYQGKVNFIIRLHYPGTVPDDNYALSWAATLGELAKSTSDVIYVYPWNEPNMPRECGGNSDCTAQVKNHVAKLKGYLKEMGLWQTKIKVLSPMINQSAPNFQSFVNQLGSGFFGQFDGQTMNLYDFERNYGVCGAPTPLNACKVNQVLNMIPGGKAPIYGVETGVVDQSGSCPAQVTDCPFFDDNRMFSFLKTAYENYWLKNPRVRMASPLFYNPELSDHPVWLWGGKTESYLKNLAKNHPGSTTQTTFDKQKVDDFINTHLEDGSLQKCANSCGVATSQDLCVAASGGTGSGYDTSRFSDYNVDSNKFYIHPIKGLIAAAKKNPTLAQLWASKPSRHIQTIREDLIRQGYEAACAAPTFKIQLTEIGQQWMKDYLQPGNKPKGVAFGAEELKYSNSQKPSWERIGGPFYSTFTIDYRNSLYPVFRDVTNKRFLMSSLEEFFGFKDKTGKYSDAEINSGAINSLVDQTQRCTLGAVMLTKQEKMCQKLADETKCALYPQVIPHSQQTILTALNGYKQYVQQHQAQIKQQQTDPVDYTSAKTAKTVCQQVLSAKADKKAKQLAQTLLQVPLTIDRGYRLAFLVTSLEMKYPHGTQSMFNFFEHPNAGFFQDKINQPRHGILVVAFKIPDITTNKGNGANNLGNTYWQDPAQLTEFSLLTERQRNKIEQRANDRTNLLLSEATKYYNRPQTADDEIFCTVGAEKADKASQASCSSPLMKTLTDIIGNELKSINKNLSCGNYQANSVDARQGLAATIFDRLVEVARRYIHKKPSVKTKIFCTAGAETNSNIGAPECNDPLSRSLTDIINAQAKLAKNQPSLFDTLDCGQYQAEPSDTKVDNASFGDTTLPGKRFKNESFGYDLLNQLFTDSSHIVDKSGKLSAQVASSWEKWKNALSSHEIAAWQTNKSRTVGWGLKSIFYVVPAMSQVKPAAFPYSSISDPVEVKQYLVYPEGYNLKMIESVLADSFFTQAQLTSLTNQAQAFEHINGSGEKNQFNGATLEQTYKDYNPNPPNWNRHLEVDGYIPKNANHGNIKDIEACGPVYQTISQRDANGNLILKQVQIGWRLPCERKFSFKLEEAGAQPIGFLGGKLGFWLRKTQQALTSKTSATWDYLQSCQNTEQFLTGQCGQ